MFAIGTIQLTPSGAKLFAEVAALITEVPNRVMIRGQTDAAPWSAKSGTNNWRLSVARAGVTRHSLDIRGILSERFARIERVADREPYVATARFEPSQRRISLTLGWRGGAT